MSVSWTRRVTEAAEYVSAQRPVSPRIGIVLGSGLGKLADAIQVDAVLPYDTIPHLPRATALGHSGELILGQLAGVDVVAMRGRVHLYEGYSIAEATLPIGLMHALGARLLLLSNASGGLNPSFRSGEIMLIEDHINLMLGGSPALPVGQSEQRSSFVYDPDLLSLVLQRARQNKIPIRVGVYVGLKGPNYETRAEYRFLRTIGGDAVGMSTVPEAAVGRHLGMQVVAFSTIANVAHPDALTETSGDEVVAVAESTSPQLLQLIELLIADWNGDHPQDA